MTNKHGLKLKAKGMERMIKDVIAKMKAIRDLPQREYEAQKHKLKGLQDKKDSLRAAKRRCIAQIKSFPKRPSRRMRKGGRK